MLQKLKLNKPKTLTELLLLLQKGGATRLDHGQPVSYRAGLANKNRKSWPTSSRASLARHYSFDPTDLVIFFGVLIKAKGAVLQ